MNMARRSKHGHDAARERLRGDILAFALVGLLLWAVNRLPPDTTLQQVRSSGVLRVCVPDEYPPLVTRDPEFPGLDVAILHEVARELNVRLLLIRNSAIGRDFNPRNWRLTRAQCLVIAGGVLDTPTTRGLLVVSTPHLETGWAAVTAASPVPTSLAGVEVAFFAGLSGLDRINLSRWLREHGAIVTTVSNRASAIEGLASGRFDVIVSEALNARHIAGELAGRVVWLPLQSERVPLGFGLWKGDLTLERAVERALRAIAADGRLTAIQERYDLSPIEEACFLCG